MEPLILDLSVVHPLTDDELFALCAAHKSLKIERTQTGALILMAPIGGESSARESYLIYALYRWNQETRDGITFSSAAGFLLPDGSMRAPDAAWITAERWQGLSQQERDQFVPLCPDFVIELMSRSDRLTVAQEKMRAWIDNGCRLAWLISPKDERAWVYRADGSVTALTGFDQALDGDDVLPGFSLPLTPLR